MLPQARARSSLEAARQRRVSSWPERRPLGCLCSPWTRSSWPKDGYIIAWTRQQTADRPAVVASSADPGVIEAVQARFGRDEAGTIVEDTFAEVARRLVADGVTRLIVAGGETSGAVVAALGVGALAIGPEIDPGVPWTRTMSGPPLALALKSGNFGAPDFFLKAWEILS